jgi:hypothetical protein
MDDVPTPPGWGHRCVPSASPTDAATARVLDDGERGVSTCLRVEHRNRDRVREVEVCSRDVVRIIGSVGSALCCGDDNPVLRHDSSVRLPPNRSFVGVVTVATQRERLSALPIDCSVDWRLRVLCTDLVLSPRRLHRHHATAFLLLAI